MKKFINIAIPKGRLFQPVLETFEKAGLCSSSHFQNTRKLVLREGGLKFLILKARDVPVFLQIGSADLGIMGDDILREMEPEIDVLLDLKFGEAYFVLAGKPGTPYPPPDGFMKVATKYPRITEKLLRKENLKGEIITLYGSVEIASATGVAPYIADLSSTGKTLKENNLIVLKKFFKSSAKLCANRASLRTKYTEIKDILNKIKGVIKNENHHLER